MSWFTSIRDGFESVASVVGNYFYPGSGMVTSQLVSKGAAAEPGYQMAMIGSGIAGGMSGNMSNYGATYDAMTGAEATGGSLQAPSWYSGSEGTGAQGLDASLIGQDKIETLYNVSKATGIEDYTAAAESLGYDSVSSLLSAANPAWGTSSLGGPGTQPGAPQVERSFNASPMDRFGNSSNPLSVMQNGGKGTGAMPWGSPGNLMTMGSGLYSMYQAEQLKKLAAAGNPWMNSGGQSGAAEQLKNVVMGGPGGSPSMEAYMKTPAYQARMQAVERSMAAQGYNGSGNMAVAAANAGGAGYNEYVAQMAGLSGALNPVGAAQVGLQGATNAASIGAQGLNTLGYGAQMAQPFSMASLTPQQQMQMMLMLKGGTVGALQ